MFLKKFEVKMKADANEEKLYSVPKLAESLGITPVKLKKVITEMNIEPTTVKCRCNYYSEADVEKIKANIK